MTEYQDIMSNYTIRKADLSDLSSLGRLFNNYRIFYGQVSDIDSSIKFLQQRMSKEESVIFVSERRKREISGFVQLYPSFSSVSIKRTWILNDLFVDENHRKKGIGEALMKTAENHVRTSGARGLTLATAVDNDKAQRLYEKLGYQKNDKFFFYSFFFQE